MQDAALWIVETEAVAVMIFSSLWGASRHCIVVHLFCHIVTLVATPAPAALQRMELRECATCNAKMATVGKRGVC